MTPSFYEELIVATVGSLIGSVVGAVAGAWLAWRFSRRLFEDEAKARDKSEREARAFDRRREETNLVEAWEKLLMKDFQALSSVRFELERANQRSSSLDIDAWPIRRYAPPTGVPVIVGPLKTAMGAASAVLWALHDTLGRNVQDHRQGRPTDPAETTLLIAEVLAVRGELDKALRAELTALSSLE